jgi:lipopolysaccharide export LptBFGC system permease protein LptF
MAAKKKKEELTALQTLGYFIKEILGAFALIGFGLVLYAYADDIGAWFGSKVQEAADYIFKQLGY